MLNINEEELKAAIVSEAADQIVRNDDDLSGMVSKEVTKRINKIFADRVEAQIQAAIDAAVVGAFDTEYQKVTSWGQPDGPATTVRKQLEKTVAGYWTDRVDASTGKPSSTDYSSVTRAEYLMTQICAEDFTAAMKASAINVTGALKDGLRNQIGKQMDVLLNDLFRIKSLQDQGKVEKPY